MASASAHPCASSSWQIVTNADGAVDGQLCVAPLDEPAAWRPLRSTEDGARLLGPAAEGGGADGRSLDAAFAFASFAAVTGRQGGFSQVRLVPGHVLPWPRLDSA